MAGKSLPLFLLLPAVLAAVSMRALAGDPGGSHACDRVLRRGDARHGTLGSTGHRLFADRVETAPGLRGRFGYGGISPEFRDPLVLTPAEGDTGDEILLGVERITWYPSHVEIDWRAKGLLVKEWKCITGEDALVDRVSVFNTAKTPVTLRIRARSTQARFPERFRSQQIPVDPGPAAVHPAGDPGLPSLPSSPVELEGIRYLFARRSPGARGRREGEERSGAGGHDPTFMLPDAGRTAAFLHLLLLPGPGGEGFPAAASAGLVFSFHDGTSERVPFPVFPPRHDEASGASPGLPPTRIAWHAVLLPGGETSFAGLTYAPPPGRFLHRCTLVREPGESYPVLPAATLEIPPPSGRMPVLLGRAGFHGLPVYAVLAGEGFAPVPVQGDGWRLERTLHLEPGAEKSFNVVLALGPKRFPLALAALDRAEDPAVREKHLRVFHEWFEKFAPSFTASDPLMERAWTYRWFLARQALMRLDLPEFSLPVFFEGLHDPSDAAVTLRSTPWILQEVRWLRDRRFAQGQLRALLMRQDEKGLLSDARIGARGKRSVHTGWIPAAALGAFRANGSMQFLKEVLPLLARNVEGVLAAAGGDGGSPRDPKRSAAGADLVKRVEEACHLYASAAAAAEGYRVLGEAREARRFEALAQGLRETVLKKMRTLEDETSRPLEAAADGALPYRIPAVLYPAAFGIPPLDSAPLRAAVRALLHPSALPRPAAACLAAEALVAHLRRGPGTSETDKDLRALIEAYTRLHFEGGDPALPLLRTRRGPGMDGAAGNKPDPFCSAYNDLLIRFVGGLTPRSDGRIELRPLVKHLAFFRFQGIPYHGRRLDIAWDRPDGKAAFGGIPEGYSLFVDGKRRVTLPELKPLVVDP